MKGQSVFIAVVAGAVLSAGAAAQSIRPKTSGVYLTAADFKEGRLSYEGECSSKAHRLELHDVLHKSYIHVTHEGEKRRYAKSELFGFRACSGRDYRFVSNLEYQIVETRGLYLYAREVRVSHGRGTHAVPKHYFSVAAGEQVQEFRARSTRADSPSCSFRAQPPSPTTADLSAVNQRRFERLAWHKASRAGLGPTLAQHSARRRVAIGTTARTLHLH